MADPTGLKFCRDNARGRREWAGRCRLWLRRGPAWRCAPLRAQTRWSCVFASTVLGNKGDGGSSGGARLGSAKRGQATGKVGDKFNFIQTMASVLPISVVNDARDESSNGATARIDGAKGPSPKHTFAFPRPPTAPLSPPLFRLPWVLGGSGCLPSERGRAVAVSFPRRDARGC